MSAFDKLLQSYTLIMGNEIKIIVLKNTTNIDAPPKRKHVFSFIFVIITSALTEYVMNPRANFRYLVFCLSKRFHNKNWIITLKSLLTTHILTNCPSYKFIRNLAKDTDIFKITNCLQNDTMSSVNMNVLAISYANFLKQKCKAFNKLEKDITSRNFIKENFKLSKLPQIFTELELLHKMGSSILETMGNFFTVSSLFHAVQIFLIKDMLHIYSAEMNRLIFLVGKCVILKIENVDALSTSDYRKLCHLYKYISLSHLNFQKCIYHANAGKEGPMYKIPYVDKFSAYNDCFKCIMPCGVSSTYKNELQLKKFDSTTNNIVANTTAQMRNTINYDPIPLIFKLEECFDMKNCKYDKSQILDLLKLSEFNTATRAKFITPQEFTYTLLSRSPSIMPETVEEPIQKYSTIGPTVNRISTYRSTQNYSTCFDRTLQPWEKNIENDT
ncbi:hypothetical protein HZS_548, partial [Henneguya salminicola]